MSIISESRQGKCRATKLLDHIQAWTNANVSFYETSELILKLTVDAEKLYIKSDQWLRHDLLKLVLCNCTLTYGIPHYDYKKPFDIHAKGSDSAIWQSQRDLNPCCRLERAVS